MAVPGGGAGRGLDVCNPSPGDLTISETDVSYGLLLCRLRSVHISASNHSQFCLHFSSNYLGSHKHVACTNAPLQCYTSPCCIRCSGKNVHSQQKYLNTQFRAVIFYKAMLQLCVHVGRHTRKPTLSCYKSGLGFPNANAKSGIVWFRVQIKPE